MAGNENTVSIEYTADGRAAISTANTVAETTATAVDRMTKSTETAATTQGTTWKQFYSERMGEYMRLEGGHAAAMKRMSVEWAAYKASGVLASQQVAAATQQSYDHITNTMSNVIRQSNLSEEAAKRLAQEEKARGTAAAEASASVSKALASETAVMDGIIGKVKNLAAEAAAAFGVFKLAKEAKDATMFAANVEQANRALSVIANNMGHTSDEAMKARDSVRDLGITTNSATNATAQFLRAGLPMEKLNVLARAAQGAAISYAMMTGETISSSEALDKMIRSIVTGNVTELHTLGINVLLRDQLRENRVLTGEAATAVDSHRRHQMLLNAALEQSGPLLNLYTNSMDLTSKKISSAKRPVEELKLALGDLFLPELSASASTFYNVVSGGMQTVRTHTAELQATREMIRELSVGFGYGATVLGVYYTGVTVAAAATGGLAAGAGVFSGVIAVMRMELSLTGAEAVITSTKIGMMGDTIATTSTVATLGLASIKTSLGVLSAFMVGWEFGKMLNARFESVRNVGTEVVWGLIRGWNELGFAAQEAMAHMDPTTSHARTQLIIAQIRAERDAWLKTWRETKAEQLTDNAAGPPTGAVTAPYVDNKAAIAAGIAAEKERLRKEQEMRDQAAAAAAEKERKRQADIQMILAQAREEDLLIGKEKDEKELIQLDLKHQREMKNLKAHKATEAQVEELAAIQKRTRADMVAQQALEKRKAQAAAEAEIARRSFEEQAAWLQKLDDFKLKTGKISETEATANKFDRERQLLELKQKEIDSQIALEKHEQKRIELVGLRQVLQNQINHSYAEEGMQLALNAQKEETLYFAHQQQMKSIAMAGMEARLQFIGQERGALTAHYAWKRQLLNDQYVQDMAAIDLTQAQKLAKEREYVQQSLALEQERVQKQADLWWNSAQSYMQYAQQMTAFSVQMLLSDESQRSQIGKRMLATSIRFLAQYLQQFMFNKAKEHLLAAAGAAGQTTVQMAQHTSSLTMLEIEAQAWAAFLSALASNPYGGEPVIPAAVAMTAVANGVVPAAMGAVAGTGGASIASELGMAAAWGIGGVLVGGAGEGLASSIEGNTPGTAGNPIATTPGTVAPSPTATPAAVTTPAANPAPTINIHVYGNVLGDADALAREIYPAIRRAANDGVR